MSLVQELIKGLLPEDEKKKVVAVYGGGFKPPTKGHFAVVKQAIKENPNVDEFVINIGGKERDGVTPEEAIQIWDIYKQYLPISANINIQYSSTPPIKATYDYAKNHPDEEVLFIIGAREGNDDDFKDISDRTKSLDKYPNLNLRTIVTQGGVSGTAARNASKISLDKFKPFVPSELSDEEVEQVYNIVANKVTEGKQKLNEQIDSGKYNFTPYIGSLTKYMIDNGLKLDPYPQIQMVHDDIDNGMDLFGKTAYFLPSENIVVLFTYGRHPKDILRSYAHELIHVHQNNEGRLENYGTTNVNQDDHLEQIEREAYETGNIMFRSWTDSLNKNELKELLTEGKYDSLVTKLARFTLNAWKGDLKDGQETGFFELEIGPGLEFDYPHLKFLYQAKAKFGDVFKPTGSATPNPSRGLPKVQLRYYLATEDLPRMWEQIAFDLRNTIRHEIEHLMQSGPNVKKGKEMKGDYLKRKELMTGEKPWWAIWRDKYKDAEYYKLEKEVDANLQGLYLKAKKVRKPLEFVIDNYLNYDLNLPSEDIKGIKALWRERAPKINVPVFESKPIFNWEKKVTIPGPVPPAFLEGDVLTYEGYKEQRDFPVKVKKVEWGGFEYSPNEYTYTLQLLRDLNSQKKRGLIYTFQSEEDIKERLADKQLTRAEFERQPTNRKDSFDKPITYKGIGHFQESKIPSNWEKRVTIVGPEPPAFLEGELLTYEGYKKRKIDGKLKPQRDYPVEVIEVKWNEDKKEYDYTVMLLRDLGYGEKRGMKVPGKSEKEIKDKLAKKQLTRVEFERQPTNRKDNWDRPIKLPKMGSPFGWYGESKILEKEPLNEFSLPKFDVVKPIIDKFLGGVEKAGKKLLELVKKEGKQTLVLVKEIAEWVIKGEKPNEAEQKKINKQISDLGFITILGITGNLPFGPYAILYFIIQESGIAKEFLKLDEEKNKDPFGLMAYARELGNLNEEESEYKVYLDMDGVVANFDKRFEDLSGMQPRDFEEKYGKNKFWDFIDEDNKVSFWVGIPVMPGAAELVNAVKKYNYELLTAPSVKKQSYLGKILWVRNHSDILGGKPRINFKKAKNKHQVKDNLSIKDILIDDREDTIERWETAGGKGIHYKNAGQVINDLKKLGL